MITTRTSHAPYPASRPLQSSPATRPAIGPVGVLAFGVALALGCGETLDAVEGGDGGSGFTSIYSSTQFQTCGECHAPGAQGRYDGIEKTQDWSTRATALRTLRGNASGLLGNNEGCNGAPLLGSSAEQSLLVASLDSDVRTNFSLSSFPDCTGDAISDQTLKLGGAELPAALLQNLKDWIDAGAPDN